MSASAALHASSFVFLCFVVVLCFRLILFFADNSFRLKKIIHRSLSFLCDDFFSLVEKTAGDAEKSREYCEKIAKTAKSEEELPVWCFQDVQLVRTVTQKRLDAMSKTSSSPSSSNATEPFVSQSKCVIFLSSVHGHRF
jgi:hypothetical protein